MNIVIDIFLKWNHEFITLIAINDLILIAIEFFAKKRFTLNVNIIKVFSNTLILIFYV